VTSWGERLTAASLPEAARSVLPVYSSAEQNGAEVICRDCTRDGDGGGIDVGSGAGAKTRPRTGDCTSEESSPQTVAANRLAAVHAAVL